ncbi:class I SAM-dependent methyltransferase [Patescibacteria group bacterium]|nr:class I SAM-dependent methyltransferase [Patescibacteria group bacterium]
MVSCKICKNESVKFFSAIVLDKYTVEYFSCSNCGFLQTEDPFWINESYKTDINFPDTSSLQRNINLSKSTLVLFYVLFGKNKKFLDYAGGYGIFTRLMRDAGLDFYWFDLYCDSLFAKRFEYKKQAIEALTCFECFEHFNDPIKEIEEILKISRNIFFSTSILPVPTPKVKDWTYYGFDHGQHISFYSTKTLKYIAQKYSLNFCTDGKKLHMFTEKNISNFEFKAMLLLANLGFDSFLKFWLKGKTKEDYDFVAIRGYKKDSNK